MIPGVSAFSVALSRRLGLYVCFALCWLCLFSFVGVARSNDSQSSAEQPLQDAQGRNIESGYVIVDGKYLPLPYKFELRDGAMFIGDHPIPADDLMQRMGRGGGGPRGGRRAGRGSKSDDPGLRLLTRVERQLENDALLIVCGDEVANLVPSRFTVEVFNVLLSESSLEDKVAALIDCNMGDRLSSTQWTQIIKNFEPAGEFGERVRPSVDSYHEQREEFEAQSDRYDWYEVLSSRPVSYGLTITSMMLAVIATGNLLTSRPQGRGRWSETSEAVEDRQDVVRNVVLLALLGGFDLVLTLFAQQAGTLLELNPLGSEMITSPILLAAFKLTSLAGVCLILVALRGYRGAQIASWWLCLVCTIVIFRWVTFNSLFMS